MYNKLTETNPTKGNQMIEYTVKVYANGDKFWYLNGQLHREDGPACEYAGGSKYWYLNGQRHREDGPACEYADGSKQWYLNGKKLTEAAFNKKMNPDPCADRVVEIDGKKYRLQPV